MSTLLKRSDATPSAESPGTTRLSRFRVRLPRLGFYQAVFWAYIIAALVIFTFLVPPFQKSDEPAHFHRAVSLTNLDFVCHKDEKGQYYFLMKRKYADLPDVLHTWDVAFKYEVKFDKKWLQQDFSDPAYDQPAPIYRFCSLPAPGYLPSSLGVLLGKPFENPLYSFYGGRIAGGLFFVLSILIAVKVTPERYKLIVYGYAALPIVLHQVTAVSYDAVHLSLFPLVFAYLAKFVVEGAVKPNQLLIFMGLLLWIINVRLLAYFPFVLIFFVVRPSQISPQLSRYVGIASSFLGLTLATTTFFGATYLPRSEDSAPPGFGIDAHKQVQLVIDHPWHFVEACYKTLQTQGDLLLREMIGVYGWIDYGFSFMPYYATVFLGGLLIYYTVQKDLLVLKPVQILILFATLGLTAGSLFFSLYVVWSPVGADAVSGLQGRYFIGLVPFALLGVSQVAGSMGPRTFVKLAAVALALVFLYNIFRGVDLRYY